MAHGGDSFRHIQPMEEDDTDFTGRTPVTTWVFFNEDVEKLSCFDYIIEDYTRDKTIIVKKESDPMKKVTITLFDKSDTFTCERMTKIQRDLKNVFSRHITVEREHVDAAKELLKENEVYKTVKLFPTSDFRKITIYSKTKEFVDSVANDWDYKVSRLSRGNNSRYIPEQNEKPVFSSSYFDFDTTGNRMHSNLHCVCTTKEQLKVFVHCHSILKAEVDVIVNAANEDLNHTGGVAGVIARAAGQKLIDESNALIVKYGRFKATEVQITSGGNLRYKFVLHAIGPRWKNYPNKMDCLADLEKTIINVLNKAKTIGFKSIALPAISAGVFEVPQELCAEVYAIAIHMFSKEHGLTSSITDIHFVDVDPQMIQKIKDAFENFEKSRTTNTLALMQTRHPNIRWTSPSSSVYTPESRSLNYTYRSSSQNTASQHHGLPSHQKRSVTPSQSGSTNQHLGKSNQQNRVTTPSQSGRTKLVRLPDMTVASIPVKCFQFKNGLTVKIYTGSIVKFHGDAIVISADTSLSGIGFLGEAVRKAGGQDYEKEFERMKKMKSLPKPGDVLYCKGGKIGAKNVIHLVLSQLSSTLEQKMNEYKKCLMNALEEINGRSWKKIAMPLLGAGFIEKDTFDLQKCCLAWFFVLSDFTFNKEHTCLIDEVHLINKNPKITSTLCDTFETNCSKDPNTAFNNHGQKSNRGSGRQTKGAHSFGPRTGGNADNLGSSFRNNGHGSNLRVTGHSSSLRESGHRSSKWEGGNGSSFRNLSAIDIERRGQQGIEKSRGNRSSADLNQSGARPKEPLRRSRSTPQATDVDKEFDVEAFFQTNQSSRTKTTGNLNIIDSGTEDSEEDDLYEDVSFKDKPLKSKSEEESAPCVICLSDITNGMKLDCGHEFCKECLQQSFQQHKQACPVCGTIFGIVKGNQPINGTMKVKKDKYSSLPGYEGHGTITIKYFFPNGVQGPEHPNPGQSYEGTERRGFLPDNEEGRKVLRLLQKAFDRRLTFTIGHSRTTGKDNIVTWNDIHHKTKRDTGAQGFGYPDPTYLQRVQEELAAKGVTE